MDTLRTIQFKLVGYIFVVGALLATICIISTPVATADSPVTPTPSVSIKNKSGVIQASAGQDSFVASAPATSSKNYAGETAPVKSAGTTLAIAPHRSSKNYDSDALSATALDDIKTAASSVITCGDSGNLNWTTTSSTFQAIRQCTLSVPQDGWVFISANSSVARQDGDFEAQFEIGIDTTGGDPNIDRWVNVYDDGGDGTDQSVALSVLKPVTAGTHTFYFLGQRYTGAGTVLLYDPTLTVMYIPSTNAEVLPCGTSGNLNWTTTSSTFQAIRQCSLSVPQDSWAFISADSSVARQDGEFEAQFEIGIDSTSGDPNIDRWVNVYDDGGDGTDQSAALSVLKPVTAGTHTFYFLGRRYTGAGTVLLYDPTLTVIVPSQSGGKVFLPLILKQYG